MGFFTVILPLPVMVLGCVVVVVQTLVFALLTCIYIGLATEHEEH
jgi:F-type H+-transporting ATPase subunit a